MDQSQTPEQSPDEIAVALGERIRGLRLAAGQTQAAAASKAGVSERSLRDLENGQGSTVQTLVRVLKAIDALDFLDTIAPEPTLSPLQRLKGRSRRRARSRD